MSDIVKDLLFRASDQDGIGWTPTTVVHVPAGLLHRAADRIAQLEAYALKAFTVVEFCAGEGLLLPHPHFDCDDLLMEGVDLLKVETSEEARAALGASDE